MSERIESYRSGGYGYEAVSGVDTTRELRAAAERAVEASKALTPPLSVGVGRYDLVVSGSAMGRFVAQTLGRALDAERVLGFQTNRSGTSFAAPPAQVLGQMQVASPLVTVRADRSRPHGYATVAWDDEGVPPDDFTLVEDGVVVDYLTTRETASELAESYRRRGEAVRSHGCATGAGQELPDVRLPNLTLEPGPDDLTEDDLIAGIDRGFYVEVARGSPDHQVLNTQYMIPTAVEHLHHESPHGAAHRLDAGRHVPDRGWQDHQVDQELPLHESPFFVLNRVDAAGEPVRASAQVVAPRLKLADFNFTSLTDAI